MVSSGRPDTAEQWRGYLAEYSADFLRAADADRLAGLGSERRASGWLGFAGAGPDALAAVEERLGTPLPPGYRAFLQASDGWLEMGPFVWTMRTTADVGWVRDLEPDLCDEDDEDYELMARALLVSADADACYWLLDPADVNGNGEWAAYVWASWYPGLGDRFVSFADLVAAEREEFEELNARDGRAIEPAGAAELVAEGRLMALRGDAAGAAERFESAARKGSGAGQYLSVVLAAFRQPDVHHRIRNDVLGHPHVIEAVGAGRVRAELVPLFLKRESGAWARRLVEQALGDSGDAPVSPEPSDFTASLDRARELARSGDTDTAWSVVAAAVPHWRSDDPLGIAPLTLLTDPELSSLVTPQRAAWIVTTSRSATH
ncbi:SMI1/KNR4 family protein [Actinoplanes solisilvae]|uniref:SMI1/KNR4 family protein n=1 Tax=Actinoplanes solisilvae TaxID=2486853 RepID=UPI000FD9285C|nr:SMI1/KNR4 family protein [Actinoplanes solisilvae]